MRLLFDVLAATERSGGMRLHAREILDAWVQEFPRDELTVLSGRWGAEHLGDQARVQVWPSERIIGRAVGQLVIAPAIATIHRSEAIVSLSPIVSPFRGSRIGVCFQHDWRHKRNPSEFSRAQHVYRRLWELSASRADLNGCISEKAARETRALVPGARTAVFENGRDHARRWKSRAGEATGESIIVTFGHHNNKRPELVIGAVGLLKKRLPLSIKLVVLGASGEYRRELQQVAGSHGVSDLVDFPGYVDDDTYQEIISSASVVVMASTDEGFGLPVAEAQFLGIPAVVAAGSGMDEIFGDFALVADPEIDSFAESIGAALTSSDAPISEAHLHTWVDTVRATRNAIDIARSSHGRENRA